MEVHQDGRAYTHISLSIQCVVGEFGSVERYGPVLPVFTSCGRVWVDEHPVRESSFGSSYNLPFVVLETVAEGVYGYDVQQEDVTQRWVQAGHLHF